MMIASQTLTTYPLAPALGQPRWASRGLPVAIAALAAVLLVFVPWPANLMLVGLLAAFLLELTRPPLALGALLLSIPIQANGDVSLGPVILTVTNTIFYGVLAAWLLRVTLLRRPLRGGVVAALFATYVLVLLLSVVSVLSVADWAEEVNRWATALAVYVIAVDAIGDARSARPAVIGTALGALVACAIGLYQVVAHAGPASFSVGGLTRAYSTFGQPNPFAGYLELTIPLLVALVGGWLNRDLRPHLRRACGGWTMLLVSVAAALGLLCLLLTQSRGGWAGAAVGLGAIVWLTGSAVRWGAIAAGVVVVSVVLVTPAAGWVTSRLASSVGSFGGEVLVTPSNFAIQERLAHWGAGINMARDHPWLGVGAGNFTPNFREETPVWRFRISRGHAHNAYIQAAAQSGIVGLIVYLLFLGAVGLRLARALRAAGRSAARVLVIGAIGVTLAFAIHNIFDYLHVLTLGVQLSVVWALAETGTETAFAHHVPGAQPAKQRMEA